MSAQEIRAYRSMNSKLVKVEELDKLMGNLIERGIGFKEEEEFIIRENLKLKGAKGKKLKKDFVLQLMKLKLRDNRILGEKIRNQRNKLRGKIEETLGQRSRQCRWIVKSVKENNLRLRQRVRKKNVKKFNYLVGKYEVRNNVLDELSSEDRLKYGKAMIFDDDSEMGNVECQEPIIVCSPEDKIELSEDEIEVLRLGPKFCVLKALRGKLRSVS